MLLPFFTNRFLEAGVDEAGRGCFAGPVFAAAVVLPENFFHPLLNDSKQLTEKQRDELRPIIEKESIAWAVSSVGNEEIDRINILRASFKAMHRAINKLPVKPNLLLIDGNRFNAHKSIPHQCIVKGDATYSSIAAAGILAKTHRDEYMYKLHKKWQMYKWDCNKGYGTAEHREAIAQYGLTIHHRKSFKITAWEMEEAEVQDFETVR